MNNLPHNPKSENNTLSILDKISEEDIAKYCKGDNKSKLPCELCHGYGFWEVPMSNNIQPCPNLLRQIEENKNKL